MSFSSEQIVVVADVGSFLQQLPVLEVLDTAVAVLDIQFNYLYKNATFEQLRIPIFDADSAQDVRRDYAEIFTVLAATVASKQRQVCEYRH